MANEAQLVQQLLNDAGFDAGTVDGRFGPQTRAALERFRANAGTTEPAQVAAIQQALQAVADAGVIGRRDNIEAITSSIEAAAAVATPAPAPAAEAPAADAVAVPAAETPVEAPAAEAPVAEVPPVDGPVDAPAADAPALPVDAGLPDLSPEAAAEIAAEGNPTYALAAPNQEGYETVWKTAEAWRNANPDAFVEGGEFAGVEGDNNRTQAVVDRIYELNGFENRYTCTVDGVRQYAPAHADTGRFLAPGEEFQLPAGNGVDGVARVTAECDVCEPAPTPTPRTPGGTPQPDPQPQPQPQPELCTSLPAGGLSVAIDTDRDGRTDTRRNVNYGAFMRLVPSGEAYPGEVRGVGTSLPGNAHCAPIGNDGGGRDPEPEPGPSPAPDCDGCGPTGPGDEGVETGFLHVPGVPLLPGVQGGQSVLLADAGAQTGPNALPPEARTNSVG